MYKEYTAMEDIQEHFVLKRYNLIRKAARSMWFKLSFHIRHKL